jgi:predicted small lipoprotein YifL
MTTYRIPLLLLAILLLSIFLAACAQDGPTVLPMPTETPTPTITPTTTLTPTATLTPTITPTPEVWPTDTPTATITPTPTVTSTSTPIPTATPTGTPIPPPTPTPPSTINGVPYNEIIVMDDEVKAHVKEIYARGQEMGRDPHAFSKLGDSLIANPYFLRIFDQADPNLGTYNLGDYAFLQDIIDYYKGSYDRYGTGIHVGLHTWSVFDPMWASKKWCKPNENLLDCEIRLNNPSVMLVLLGTNDDAPQATFETNYDKIVKHIIDQGIVPILFTKADRFEGDNRNNESIRKIAEKYKVPLVDFDKLADTLPNRGTGPDNIHLSIASSNDYTDPETFRFGNTVHNLATLVALDRVRSVMTEP